VAIDWDMEKTEGKHPPGKIYFLIKSTSFFAASYA
jgi:hypothetical protein